MVFFKKNQCRPRMHLSGTRDMDPRLKLAGMTMMFVAAFFLPFSGSPAFAQMPVSMSGMTPAVTPVFEKVGVVAAVQGKVKLKIAGQAGHIAESGEPVFISQEVTTDAKGHLQILLLDETIFTIGPNSSIVIDKFIYDPKSHEGEIRASILAGVFRYVSGKIAAKKSDSVSVKLPNATIGFRGTIVGGQVNPDGSALAALLGPGDNNDANAQVGSFTIEGEGGESQDVNRTGFGVQVGATGGLSGVFQLSTEQVNNLTSGLAPSSGSGDQNSGSGSQGSGGATGGASDSQSGGTGGQSGGSNGQDSGNGGQTGGTGDQGGPLLGGGDMSTLSGEAGALTGESSSLTGSLTNLSSNLNTASTQEAQNAASSSETVSENITTFSQLARVTSGTGHYNFSGDFKNLSGDVVGTLEGRFVVHFGDQQAFVGGTDVWVTQGSHTVTTFDNTYIPLSFSIISSSGTFSASGAWGFDESMNHVGDFDITIALRNQNGITAQQATAIVKYVKILGNVDSGTGSSTGSIDRSAVFVASNGLTSLVDLGHVATGISHYDFAGTYKNLAGYDVGTVKARCLIDFGNQKIGGGDSWLKITMNGTDGPSVSTNGIDDVPSNFDKVSNGVISWTNGDAMQGGVRVGTFDTISVTLKNANGVIAQQATASVTYTDGFNDANSGGVPNGSGTCATTAIQAGS